MDNSNFGFSAGCDGHRNARPCLAPRALSSIVVRWPPSHRCGCTDVAGRVRVHGIGGRPR
eukprot:10315630-Alexandrium_andersonii.AAC.1